MFGFDLFGRPPIQLPDDDADDAPLFRRHRHRSGSGSTPTTTLTTQTFDSDAAPLDVSTIQEISVSKATEAAEAEVKRLKEKEERRQRRKARKAMRRLVEADVVGDGEEFEGFQGSGGLALVKRPTGAGGALRLRLRQGLTLVLGRNLNPSNREKTLGTLYLPLLQQQRKMTKKQIWTEVSTRARNQRAAQIRMKEPRICVEIGLL